MINMKMLWQDTNQSFHQSLINYLPGCIKRTLNVMDATMSQLSLKFFLHITLELEAKNLEEAYNNYLSHEDNCEANCEK